MQDTEDEEDVKIVKTIMKEHVSVTELIDLIATYMDKNQLHRLPSGFAKLYFSNDGKTWGLERKVDFGVCENEEEIPADKRSIAVHEESSHIGDFWSWLNSDVETINPKPDAHYLFNCPLHYHDGPQKTIHYIPKTASHVKIVMNEKRCSTCSPCKRCGIPDDTIREYRIPPDGFIQVIGDKFSFPIFIDRTTHSLHYSSKPK